MAGSYLHKVLQCSLCCQKRMYMNLAPLSLCPSTRLRYLFKNNKRNILAAVFKTVNRILHTTSGCLRMPACSLGMAARSGTRTFTATPSRVISQSPQALKHSKLGIFIARQHSFRKMIFRNVNSLQRISLLLVSCTLLGTYCTLSLLRTSQCQTQSTDFQVAPVEDEKIEPLFLQKKLSLLSQIKLIVRFLYLCVIFSPALFLHVLAFLSGSSYLESIELHYILYVMQATGPVFIKLGQWASTRRDIFSESFCRIISSLHTRCEPHSWSGTVKTLEESFGEDWEKILLILDHTPLGSGCVAQVYHGYIRAAPSESENPLSINSNKASQTYISVAVKVMHPGIVEAMHTDIRLIMYMASWVDYLYPAVYWIALQECVGEFACSMQKQLNLETEAKNLSKFNLLMSAYENVKFPRPVYPYVTNSVLVETFERGDHISKYVDNPDRCLQTTLARIGIETLLDMMFVHNFIHGDLHPGNILVQDPFTKDPKLVLVDCGIATSLGPVDFENFYKVFRCIVKGEGDKVADLFLGTQQCQTLGKYRRDMSELVNETIEHLNLRETQVATLFSQLFDILIEHKVRIEPSYTSVMVAFMVIEGVARSLDPTMDIMVYAKQCILYRSKFALKEQLKKNSKTVRQRLFSS